MLVLMLTSATSVFAESGGATKLSGQIMVNAKTPMADGVILLFDQMQGPPPNPYKYWRIPDLILPTDKVGKFSIDVPEGTFYLMAAQKSADGEIGPPKKSEFLYFHGDAQGNAKPIQIAAGSSIDLGKLTGGGMWSPDMVEREKGVTALEGTITDLDGNPVEKAIVFAYLTSEAVGKPAFISDPTDARGKYLLRVNAGGAYYLKVRSVIGGGAPESGEYTNVSKEFEPVMVNLTTGKKLEGFTLKVEKFSGVGSTGVAKPEKVWKKLNEMQAN